MGKVQVMDVVLDTNVVVSGLLFGRVPGKIVSLWKKGTITPFVSKEIIDEYVRVLAYPKFQLGEHEIEYLIYKEILPYFEVITPRSHTPVLSEDPTDDKFIHCALTKSISTIISGDRHLLDLKYYKSIAIFTPEEFLKRM